jgi:hypothetical protein
MRVAVFVLLLASCAFAEDRQANITNARLETRVFTGNLTAQLHASTPTWFGYAVKSVRMDDGGDCHSRLEGGWENHDEKNESGPVHLEASTAAVILLRVTNYEIQKVQAHPLSCEIDADGMPLVWLTGVPSGASIDFLERLMRSDDTLEGAILAISLHDDPQADTAMERFTHPEQPEKVRERAIFWLGVNRGARGVEGPGSSPEERSQRAHPRQSGLRTFCQQGAWSSGIVNQRGEERSIRSRTRQALFWLAQKAGRQASAMIVNAIRDDPDTEVKKRAVFALSQLPRDEGVPKLIEVAQTQRNAEVRKQAFFWLGQSQDPPGGAVH